MKVKKYRIANINTWEQLLVQENTGTIFHTRKFLSYHPKKRFSDHSLLFYKKNHLSAIFPAAEIKKQDKKILISHPGASFGGFATKKNISLRDTFALVKNLKSYATEHKFNRIHVTLPPIVYNPHLSNYIDFAFLKNDFTYQHREVSSILQLEPSIEKTLEHFRPSHRQAVRKAKRKGIQIRKSDNFENFYKILKKNLKIRHGVKPTHTLKELCLLNKLFPDRIVLHCAILNNEMIAGVVNFRVNPKVILAFYISHDERFQEFRPLNLLFYSIFNQAIKNGVTTFDFGIFTVKEKPNFGLARFKENFGATGIFRDTLELNLTK